MPTIADSRAGEGREGLKKVQRVGVPVLTLPAGLFT